MAVSKKLVVAVFFAVFIVEALTFKFKAGRRKKGKGKSQDDDEAIEKLTVMVEALQAKVDKMSDTDEATCSGNNVHFLFHGEGDHDHDHSDDDKHVHIDIHLDHHDHHDDHADHDHGDHVHHDHAAHCQMQGADGFIHIVQGDHDDPAHFLFDFVKLGEADTEHAVHVHQFGDLSDGCDKLGGHYDPKVDACDLGKIVTDSDGAIANTWVNDTSLTLFGGDSIIGRSIMIHDSDGSPTACCVIGWSSENHEHDPEHSHDHDHDMHSDDSHDHGHR